MFHDERNKRDLDYSGLDSLIRTRFSASVAKRLLSFNRNERESKFSFRGRESLCVCFSEYPAESTLRTGPSNLIGG